MRVFRKTHFYFFQDNFNDAEFELDSWSPPDYKENPSFVDTIKGFDGYKSWARNLNQYWSKLGRQCKDDVSENPDKYSTIPLDNPFMISGGRIKEYRYVDSFWIIEGLLASEMYEVCSRIKLKIIKHLINKHF